MIWSLLIGFLIGSLAGIFTERKYGCIGTSLAGLAGSWVGQSLFGNWGPSLAGMAIIPSVFGAAIVIAVLSYFFNR